jgi:hypothetical protein
MKKLLVLSLAFFANFSLIQSQTWFANDHRWVFHLFGGFPGYSYNFEMEYEKDTLIHGLSSKKWVFHSGGPFGFLPAFTHTNDKKAYAFHTPLDSFVLIYDLGLSVGDTVVVPWRLGKFTYRIESIDQVQAGGLTLIRQRVKYLNPNGQPTNWRFDILEKIGMVGLPFDQNHPSCSFVLLSDFECNSAVDGLDFNFLCFSSSQGSFNPYGTDCAVVPVKEPDVRSFTVLPNPASDFFSVQLDGNTAMHSLRLMGPNGQALRQWSASDLSHQYHIGDIPAGMYLVEGIFEDGSRVVRKIVKRP